MNKSFNMLLLLVVANPLFADELNTNLPAMNVIDKVDTEQGINSYIPATTTTTTKTDIPIFDTPASIQTVNKALMQDQQATRLDDALQNVSGVFKAFSFYGGDSAWSAYSLRGFVTSDKYVNGVRLPDNAYDLSRIERVEVLKGASGALFGQMDPGGVINLVTKKPKETTEYSFQQQIGSYDYYRTTASATGALSSAQKLYYRVDLMYQDAGSFRKNVDDNRYIVTPMLSWRPSTNTEFNLTYQHRNLETVYDSGIPAVNGAIANVPISTTYQQPNFRDILKGDMVDFNWKHQLNANWKLTNGVVANWNTFNFNEIPVAYFQPVLDTNNLVRRGAWIENSQRNSQTVYMNLNGKFETGLLKHNLLMGADYFNTKTDQSGYFVLGVPFPERLDVFSLVNLYNPVFPARDPNYYQNLAVNNPNDFFNSSQSWYGAYFSDQITIGNKLHLLGGGRYDWTNAKNSWQTGTDSAKGNANNEHFSPRTGIVYEPIDWLAIFANYVESFHLQDASLRSTTGVLNPETSSQYEVGFKTRWFNDQLITNVAFYDITKQNIAAAIADNLYDTIGSAKSQGVEVDINGQLTKELSLNATYAYTNAWILSGDNANKQLPNVPLNSGSLWLKYAFSQAQLRGFSVGAGIYTFSQRFADVENTLTLSAYTREDIFLAYQTKLNKTMITAQLNINNITDERYFSNSTLGGSVYHNMPGMPRSFMGSIKIEF